MKKNKMCLAIAIVISAMFVGGCATDISSNSYSDETVGEAAQTYHAVIVRVRTVKVGPDQLGKNQTGAYAGSVGGAIIGSTMGTGIGNSLMTLGGAGAGAVGGAYAEKGLKTQKGFEITVQLASGEMRTVVQANDVELRKGDKVLLMIYYNGRSRVIKEEA